MNEAGTNRENASPKDPLTIDNQNNGSIELPIDDSVDKLDMELYQETCPMESLDESQLPCSSTSYDCESKTASYVKFCKNVEEDVKQHVSIMGDERISQLKGPQTNKKSRKITKETYSKVKSLPSLRPKMPEKNDKMKDVVQKPPIGKRIMNKSLRRSNSSSLCDDNSTKDEKEEENHNNLGPYLLRKAWETILTSENPKISIELALRAKKSFEDCSSNESNLDYIMCLHVLASMYSNLGQHNEAIPLLQRSIEVPNIELGEQHALAKFVGCMWLGDIYATLGQIDNSILHFGAGLDIQKQVLGNEDPRFKEACRYVAEVHVRAFRFNEAKEVCQMGLSKETNTQPSIQEVSNRKLMGFICESKGNHEEALQHYLSINTNSQDLDVTIDTNIGDAYLGLAKYDEAIFFYQRALKTFKYSISSKEEKHSTISIAIVFVRLAEAYKKVGKLNESKDYCEKALDIYDNNKPLSNSDMDLMASGLADLAGLYESMNEMDRALNLLQKALEMYGDDSSNQRTIAGIEAQLGIIYYMVGQYVDSYETLKSSISRFQASNEKRSYLHGITLNQLGLTCVQLYAISEAAEFFKEAKDILEEEYGLHHQDTIGVYSNLAATYDALGRWDDAICLLEFILVVREEKLGSADPVVDEEKRRLSEMVKEAGKKIRRKPKSLGILFNIGSP